MVDELNYSSTNVTISAYVTLDASTSVSVSKISIVDTSTQLMKLAIGTAGSEVDICAFQGNGNPVPISVYIPAGTRLSLKAISASATSGYNTVSLLG
jgi:hypothetical protein